MTLYNEIDPFAAQWLRNLGAANLITPGVVDERSIKDIKPADLAGVKRAHFFAGIGGWDYALRLAGWPEDAEVWTGSCPCQPFSNAGKIKGFDDSRHLWPELRRLIAECRPATIFGEQVDSKAGRLWIESVRNDMDSSGYAFAYVSVNSAGVGANQIRQRLYWVADTKSQRRCGWPALAKPRSAKPRRSSAHLLPETRPDHRGSGSTLTVPDVCAPSYGVPGRVGMLRGFGNAIDPEVAAEFIMAYMEAMG